MTKLLPSRLAIIALTLGCSASGLEHEDTFRSGDRLRARVVRADGGTPLFLGWWDSELDVACSFRRASDGAMRCLPSAQVLFLEAPGSCSAGVASAHALTPVSLETVYQLDGSACVPMSTTRRWLEVGGEVDLASLAILEEVVL